MNSPKLALERLNAILEETRRDDLTLADRSGLYAAARWLIADIEELIEEELGGNGYAYEKAHKVMWSLAAILGFDITNGHDRDQHHVWALGQLSTLTSLLEPAVARRG